MSPSWPRRSPGGPWPTSLEAGRKGHEEVHRRPSGTDTEKRARSPPAGAPRSPVVRGSAPHIISYPPGKRHVEAVKSTPAPGCAAQPAGGTLGAPGRVGGYRDSPCGRALQAGFLVHVSSLSRHFSASATCPLCLLLPRCPGKAWPGSLPVRCATRSYRLCPSSSAKASLFPGDQGFRAQLVSV